MEQKSISSMWVSKEIVSQVEHTYPQNIIKYNYYGVKLYIIIIIVDIYIYTPFSRT